MAVLPLIAAVLRHVAPGDTARPALGRPQTAHTLRRGPRKRTLWPIRHEGANLSRISTICCPTRTQRGSPRSMTRDDLADALPDDEPDSRWMTVAELAQ